MFRHILAAMSLLVLAAGCSGADSKKSDSEDTTLEITLHEVNGTAWMKSLDSSLANTPQGLMRVEVRTLIPQKIGNADITALRDSLISMSGFESIKDGKGVPAPVDSTWQIVPEPKEKTDLYSRSILTVASITPELVVFRHDWSWYLGGAHGMYGTQYVNYSISKAKIIRLTDLFKPGYEETLRKLLAANVPSYINLYSSPLEVEIPRNFLIGESSITFYYAPYEIAPYSEGIVAVQIYRDDLENILRPDTESYFGPVND